MITTTIKFLTVQSVYSIYINWPILTFCSFITCLIVSCNKKSRYNKWEYNQMRNITTYSYLQCCNRWKVWRNKSSKTPSIILNCSVSSQDLVVETHQYLDIYFTIPFQIQNICTKILKNKLHVHVNNFKEILLKMYYQYKKIYSYEKLC